MVISFIYDPLSEKFSSKLVGNVEMLSGGSNCLPHTSVLPVLKGLMLELCSHLSFISKLIFDETGIYTDT